MVGRACTGTAPAIAFWVLALITGQPHAVQEASVLSRTAQDGVRSGVRSGQYDVRPRSAGMHCRRRTRQYGGRPRSAGMD